MDYAWSYHIRELLACSEVQSVFSRFPPGSRQFYSVMTLQRVSRPFISCLSSHLSLFFLDIFSSGFCSPRIMRIPILTLNTADDYLSFVFTCLFSSAACCGEKFPQCSGSCHVWQPGPPRSHEPERDINQIKIMKHMANFRFIEVHLTNKNNINLRRTTWRSIYIVKRLHRKRAN